MPNVLDQITFKHNNINTVYNLANSTEGYLNTLNGKFYKEPTFATEITGINRLIYIDKSTNCIYRYDSVNDEYIQIGEAVKTEINNLTNKDILKYDSTSGKWINDSNILSKISDVDINNIQDGDRIKWDSTTQTWINGPGAKSNWTESDPTSEAYITNKPNLGSAASVNITNAATQGSTDALSSGGAYNALAEKADSATTLAGYGITNAYTKEEVDDLVSELVTGMTWKPAVTTYADIATTYPNPQEGWTVVTTDTNIAWRYTNGTWIEISANAIPEATTEVNGLMTTAMVTKLNGIPANAEVNQHAFSNIKVDNTTVAAETKTDTLELVGSNVTLTPDATNDKVTIGITKANVTSALGYTPPTSDTNTHRPIQVNGTQILGDNTTALNLKAGSNVSLSNSNGTVTIAATDSTYPNAITNITRSGTTFTATRYNGTTFTFTQQDNNTTTGTTYSAGSCPNNTTFGTQGSIYNAFNWLNSNKVSKSAYKSLGENYIMSYSTFDSGMNLYNCGSLKVATNNGFKNWIPNPSNPSVDVGDYWMLSLYGGSNYFMIVLCISPRIPQFVYIGAFWDGKFNGWYKYSGELFT